MANLKVAGVLADMFTDAGVERVEPLAQRNGSARNRAGQRGRIRHQFKETETPAQRGIEQGDGTIRRIHGADDQDIGRHGESFARQRQNHFLSALVLFKQRQQFAKNARDVATIDFVNEENELMVGTRRVMAEFLENAVALGKDQLAPRAQLWPVALNKILIPVSRVERATAQPAGSGAVAGDGRFLFRREVFKQTTKTANGRQIQGRQLSPMGFAGARRAVENGLAFAFQDRLQLARNHAGQAHIFAHDLLRGQGCCCWHGG